MGLMYMRTVVHRNVVLRRMTVYCLILLSLIDCTENSNQYVIKFIRIWYSGKKCILSQNGVACRNHGYAPDNVSKVSPYVAVQVDVHYSNDGCRMIAITCCVE
jgi:hypothetical protein